MSIDERHSFLNISITPVECSVVCHSSWARDVFEPAIKRLPGGHAAASRVTISTDAYLILSVISAGTDAGSRVMELTSPLAMSGVPIFFITTYYSDFILVPAKDRQIVVQALQARGFEFSAEASAFVSPNAMAMSRSRGQSQGSVGGDSPTAPSTPPPSTVAELQKRTFDLLRRRSVTPYVEPGLSLVQCAGRDQSQFVDNIGSQSHAHSRRRSNPSNGGGGSNGHHNGGHHRGGGCWLDEVDTKLYTSLISALASQPRFLSVTFAQEDPPSLLLDKALLRAFGDALVGDTDGDLVPVFLDLADLPLGATGIVSGVAGRLLDHPDMRADHRPDDADLALAGELSYLSTARAGVVVLPKAQAIKALEVLRPLLVEEQ